ncbi:hypothetical protein NEOLEDRAFT_550905 [Neolentinus lepideus HHB14362 ss-1]|uniref:Uncharacterized protein n=1 Tax=Neolentinus lepideus HHB14362 ss-1 TaxID=1314782 RepID=A0A165R3Y4_9AGAM|nr:hypothetical protein NEOLEDRAFT_550905 [Neolentinus lepideus HHB14362 ss-1]
MMLCGRLIKGNKRTLFFVTDDHGNCLGICIQLDATRSARIPGFRSRPHSKACKASHDSNVPCPRLPLTVLMAYLTIRSWSITAKSLTTTCTNTAVTNVSHLCRPSSTAPHSQALQYHRPSTPIPRLVMCPRDLQHTQANKVGSDRCQTARYSHRRSRPFSYSLVSSSSLS